MEPNTPSTTPVHPGRILLVEDQSADARVAQFMLDALGYSCDWVRTGSEALRILARERYDVVLMDIHLPDLDGFETTAGIHRAVPPGQWPRIIAVTSRVLKGDREACLAAGMDDYIPKPISLQILSAKLHRQDWIAVDPRVLEHFSVAVGRNGIVQLIDTFLGTLAPMIGDIRQALDAGDASGTCRAAHSLKAAAEVLGAQAIANHALQLERLGKAGTLESAPDTLSQIVGARQETELELRKVQANYR